MWQSIFRRKVFPMESLQGKWALYSVDYLTLTRQSWCKHQINSDYSVGTLRINTCGYSDNQSKYYPQGAYYYPQGAEFRLAGQDTYLWTPFHVPYRSTGDQEKEEQYLMNRRTGRNVGSMCLTLVMAYCSFGSLRNRWEGKSVRMPMSTSTLYMTVRKIWKGFGNCAV